MVSTKDKIEHHLSNYEKVKSSFLWENVAKELSGLPEGRGLNIAHEAIDKHALTNQKNSIALRFIRKDSNFQDFTYSELKIQTSKFANVLQNLGIQKGECIFSLAGRIPELYITALGTLKYTAVFCPLYSVFGPEPIFQRLSKGDAVVLVTTAALFEKK
ncbi:AMP-binding protein [Flavobacterium myungsuense]